jgi:tight adherence protein C
MSDPVVLMTALAVAGVALAFLAAAAFTLEERRRAARSHRIDRAVGHRPDTPARPDAATQSLIAAVSGRFRRLAATTVERFAIMSGGEARDTAALLAAAGFRDRDAVVIYAFVKTVVPLAVALCGAVWAVVSGLASHGLVVSVAIVSALGLAVSKATDTVVGHLRSRRLARLRRAFPDMLELLVVASEAGLGLQPALDRVAREMRVQEPALADELRHLLQEMRLSNDLRRGFANFAQRIPLPEAGYFVQTLEQSERFGTPFSEAMRTLMRDQRADRLFRVEERAARLPVIMTIPLVFLIMPPIFVVLVGPAVLSVIDNILRGG